MVRWLLHSSNVPSQSLLCYTLLLSCLLAASLGASELDQQESNDELRDVSSDICWTGDFTRERCCLGDTTTHPDCWDGSYSFSECCPNADCWEDSSFTYEKCCDPTLGPEGNQACWQGIFTHQHCCLANSTAQSWVDVMVGAVETEQFYAMDEFYTDAQYGDDFGYYSTGHVLKATPAKVGDTQQFAHFTTYPMALSPHFARVFCRLLFVMWLHLQEQTPFRVVEMGAGSGQLAYDTQQCVRMNELGIDPKTWRRWHAAFEYVIMERSPALAQRQRERGLRVIIGDAQSISSCQPVLKALVSSPACTGGARNAPECIVNDRGTNEAGASVVLSNELLDAFAPVKLRLSLYGTVNVTDCSSWQEVRLVHAINEDELREIATGLGHSPERLETLMEDLHAYTDTVFCGMANTTIGLEARARVGASTSCLAIVLGLGELLYHVDLGVPMASHNMRLRIRKDWKFWTRLQEVIEHIDNEMRGAVVLPRDAYRQLRHQLKKSPDWEVQFLHRAKTRLMPVSVSEDRCNELEWWFKTHKSRTERLAHFYRALGYPAVHLVVRPGEQKFIDLVDCLLGPSGGFKLSLDYGATFESLGHSLSIDPRNDGIFVPPIPHELMQGLPECHNFWPQCAGRIDWTTFVDFTNLAAAGEALGWRTLFYGPQSFLEQDSGYNLTVDGTKYSIPGYSVFAHSWNSRHVQNWYGRETLASAQETDGWVQRWTSFKALLLEKPTPTHVGSTTQPILFPSWHLDTQEADPCWLYDPTNLPLPDWIPRQNKDVRKGIEGLTEDINNKLGRNYSLAYEEAQLAVRMVDWLVATGGCNSLAPDQVSKVLNSQGLWQMMKTRLLRAWGEMWGDEAVARIAVSILERISAAKEDLEPHAAPPACAGHQTYIALCESPGGASQFWNAPALGMT